MSELERASAVFHGSYANGVGKERRATHEIIGDRDVKVLSTGLKAIQDAIDAAKESPEAKGRWGHQVPSKAGRDAVQETGLSEWSIANICTSELDPSWVLSAEPENVVAMAGLLAASRDVALRFHRFSIQAVDAD